MKPPHSTTNMACDHAKIIFIFLRFGFLKYIGYNLLMSRDSVDVYIYA